MCTLERVLENQTTKKLFDYVVVINAKKGVDAKKKKENLIGEERLSLTHGLN